MENILIWLKQNFWFVLFFVWGLPLGVYRSRFRKIVYQTDSWLINIKPFFIRETRALFSNMYSDNAEYIRMRNFYRFYLAIYALLFALWYAFG